MNPNVLCVLVKCTVAGLIIATTIITKEKEVEKKKLKGDFK